MQPIGAMWLKTNGSHHLSHTESVRLRLLGTVRFDSFLNRLVLVRQKSDIQICKLFRARWFEEVPH